MKLIKRNWWKGLCVILLSYAYTAGLLTPVPRLAILNESIRNLYFHVPMWFGMTLMLIVSFVASIRYLSKSKPGDDFLAVESANTGMLYGTLGILTGMIWAKFTWGQPWPADPKLNSAAVGMLLYCAYFVLRSSITDDQQRARVSAIYNIFAFPAFLALIYIIPRLTDSLHPGNGGNPGFNSYDRDRNMNVIFYSANIGVILLAVWITSLRVRLRKVEDHLNQN